MSLRPKSIEWAEERVLVTPDASCFVRRLRIPTNPSPTCQCHHAIIAWFVWLLLLSVCFRCTVSFVTFRSHNEIASPGNQVSPAPAECESGHVPHLLILSLSPSVSLRMAVCLSPSHSLTPVHLLIGTLSVLKTHAAWM